MGKFAKKNALLFVLIFLALPFFFYKLGQSSLVNWDEAWHASIARNVIENNNFFVMEFNGETFFDHPPAGYWIISSVFRLFGVSEFSARVSQAVFGIFGLVFVYLIGKEMFGKYVGILSASVLMSFPWYLFRARTGNLDSIMITLGFAAFYFALKLVRDRKYLYPFSISASLLILTKSLLPMLFIPAYAYILLGAKLDRREVKKILLVVFVPYIVWIVANVLVGGVGFFEKLGILAFRGRGGNPTIVDNVLKAKAYIHNGIGPWFWPSFFAFVGGVILFFDKFLPFAVFLGFFLAPFAFVSRGELWHLMPVYPVFAISLVAFPWLLIVNYRRVLRVVLGGVILYYLAFQLRADWKTIVDIDPYISDEAILSKEARKFSQPFYIDDDFEPTAVFYSGRSVVQIKGELLSELFDSSDGFVLITKQWRLDESGIEKNEYNEIMADRDKLLILKE